jgi:hypothetical protein
MQKEFTMTQEDTRLQEARKGTSNVSKWPRYPTIYEINTWVWLSDLSEKSGTSTDLSSVRSADWDAIAKFGFDGEWRLCGRSGWPDNPSFQNLVAWSWVKDDDRRLIVVNLSDSAVQAQVQVPWSEVQGKTWLLADAMSDASYGRNGGEMLSPGLYVELGPRNCNFFQCSRAGKEQSVTAAASGS